MDCHEIDDLLPGFALGSVTEQERAAVLAHVATCDRHPQLADYNRISSELAASVEPVAPPSDVKRKLMARVYSDLEPARRMPWWRAWSWAAAGVMAALLAGLGVRDYVVSTQLASSPTQWQLQAATAGVQTQGTLVYLPRQGVTTLTLQQLPPLPAGNVFEVWLIKGGKPQAAGVFQPSADASASVILKGQPSGYDTVAVTREPAPDGSPAPTSAPFVLGSLQ